MLEDKIQGYLKWKNANYPVAAETYKIHLERFDEYCQKSIGEITIEDIINFQNSLKDQYAPGHICYTMAIVKNFIGYYYRQTNEEGRQLCRIDPWLVKFKAEEANHYYAISEEEYYKILSSMPENEFWKTQRKIVIRFLFETGVRASELCALNIEDINNKEHCALIKTKKGIEKGWIVWSEDLHELMIKFLGVRLCMNMDDNVFISQHRRTRPTTRTIQRWVAEAAEQAGIENHITPHGYRHGVIHYMIKRNAPELAIVRKLRHSERRSGMYPYASLNKDETIRLLEPYLPAPFSLEKKVQEQPAIISIPCRMNQVSGQIIRVKQCS